MYAYNMVLAADENELDARKRRFALLLLKKPDDAYKAALEVYGEADPGLALYVAQHWPNDPDVKAEIERLKQEHGELHFLPDKATVCRKVWEIAETAKTVAEKTSAIKLYSELMEFNPKPVGGGSQNNVFVSPGGGGPAKVMVVTKHGNDSDWASQAATQQQGLIDRAAEDLKEIEGVSSDVAEE